MRKIIERKLLIATLSSLFLLGLAAPSSATVEWTQGKTIHLEKPPVDVAFSENGKWFFVLTNEGNVEVYSADGKLSDTIAVGKQVDRIKAGPQENILLLISRQNRTIEEVLLEFVYDIDVAGAPFEGKEKAPVTVVVFSDYQ